MDEVKEIGAELVSTFSANVLTSYVDDFFADYEKNLLGAIDSIKEKLRIQKVKSANSLINNTLYFLSLLFMACVLYVGSDLFKFTIFGTLIKMFAVYYLAFWVNIYVFYQLFKFLPVAFLILKTISIIFFSFVEWKFLVAVVIYVLVIYLYVFHYPFGIISTSMELAFENSIALVLVWVLILFSLFVIYHKTERERNVLSDRFRLGYGEGNYKDRRTLTVGQKTSDRNLFDKLSVGVLSYFNPTNNEVTERKEVEQKVEVKRTTSVPVKSKSKVSKISNRITFEKEVRSIYPKIENSE